MWTQENMYPDQYESDLSEVFRTMVEAGDVPTISKEQKSMLIHLASNTLEGKKSVSNVHIKRETEFLEKVKERAALEWLKYQPFIKSIIFKYITGQLGN